MKKMVTFSCQKCGGRIKVDIKESPEATICHLCGSITSICLDAPHASIITEVKAKVVRTAIQSALVVLMFTTMMLKNQLEVNQKRIQHLRSFMTNMNQSAIHVTHVKQPIQYHNANLETNAYETEH